MIHWAKMKGRQFLGTTGQALLPVSAVMREDLNHSLLPKHAHGALKMSALQICPVDYFEKLYILILHENLKKR